jgi:EAL domain-containing protein (putative c-di-GMP-specific phosphodiesterase class I)
VDSIHDPDEAAIVATVIAMARTLRLRTVAEGIEHGDALKILRGQGCDRAQGYLFSRPVPGERFEELLSEAGPIMADARMAAELVGSGVRVGT